MSIKIESEVKLDSDPCVVAWDNKLYVGTEAGSIKTFDANLTPGASWSAHSVQLFALAAGGGQVYSSSNDGGVRVWTDQGDKVVEMPTADADVGVLRVYGNDVYAGDEAGNVIVYENKAEKARYNFLEEVKDIVVSPPLIYTVRDLDITVTEIKPDESKARYTTRHTMEGRAPLRLAGTRLLAMARGGNNLRLHDASLDNKFKVLHEVMVSDMIVTSLEVRGDYAWTAGWDGYLRRWKIAEDRLEAAGELNLGSCVNGLALTAPDNVYAIVAGGRVVRVKSV